MRPWLLNTIPPVKLLTIFIVFCLSVLAFASWEIWRLEEANHKQSLTMFEREQVAGKFTHLGEVLAMSSRMGAATGDLEWETKYLHYEKKLTRALEDAKSVLLTGECLHQISTAKDKRVEMEKKAFMLVHEGQLESATKVLRRPEYEDQKSFYHEGIVCYLKNTRQYFESEHKNHEARELRVLLYATPALLLAFICVVFAFRQYSRKEELAREELSASEAKFRQLADTTAIIFWVASSDGKQGLYINSAYEKIWGRSRASFYEDFTSWISAIHPADRERVDRAWANIVVTGKYDIEYRVVQPSGETRWVHAQGGPVHDDKGGIYRFAGTAEDITEQKLLAESLERSEETYRTVAQTANDAIIAIKGPDGAITLWNKKSAEMFGYAVDEAVGKDLHQLIVPERYRQNAHDGLRKFFETGEGAIIGRIMELSALRRDGSEFPVELSIAGMRTSNGWEAIAIVRDITERKRMEATLRESEARFHRIVEDAPFILGICDPSGRIYYINNKHQETFGYPIEKIPTVADWMALAYPDEVYRRQVIAQWNDDIRRAVAGEFSTSPARTYKVTASDGTIRDVEITFSLVDKLMYVVFYDVSEIVRTRDEVLKLIHAIKQSPVSVVITNKQGDIQYVNEKFCDVTGYTLEEAVGKNPRILKSGEQTPEFYKDLWDTILSGKEWRGKFHNKKKDGKLFWESATISPVKNAQGETTHFIAVKEDITQHIEDDKKLRFAETQLMLSEKLAGIGQLSAGVCHEILNPLNIISIQTQLLLRREEGNPDLRERLTKIRGEIGRIEKIVGLLMTFARKGIPELKPVQINVELDSALSLIEKDFNLDNIRIIRDWQSPSPEVEADTDELRQVFLNLVNNARYEMRSGGTLTVKTRLEKIGGRDHVRICFSDTGAGIKKEHLTKIFDPFFTTKPEGKGTGMGLSMAHSIVEKHGGTIRAESEEGKGAAFIIDLPVKPR